MQSMLEGAKQARVMDTPLQKLKDSCSPPLPLAPGVQVSDWSWPDRHSY